MSLAGELKKVLYRHGVCDRRETYGRIVVDICDETTVATYVAHAGHPVTLEDNLPMTVTVSDEGISEVT